MEAVERKPWLFVSQLRYTTTEEDVVNYVTNNGVNKISKCVKLDIFHENIAVFKIGVPKSITHMLLNKKIWPKNVIVRVRPFRNLQGNVYNNARAR